MNRNYLISHSLKLTYNIIVSTLNSWVNRWQYLFEVQFFQNKLLVEVFVQITDDCEHTKQAFSSFKEQCRSRSAKRISHLRPHFFNFLLILDLRARGPSLHFDILATTRLIGVLHRWPVLGCYLDRNGGVQIKEKLIEVKWSVLIEFLLFDLRWLLALIINLSVLFLSLRLTLSFFIITLSLCFPLLFNQLMFSLL